MNATAIVPSYCPDQKLTGVVKDLAQAGFTRVILVDDGSGEQYAGFFEQAAKECPDSVILRHSKNLGKGRALKTAFNYFLQNRNGEAGVVTVDGDGQHTGEDAMRCAAALEQDPGALVLGCRQFDGADVPARSAMGNRITAWCFRVLCGLRVSDTQTGLRAIGAQFARDILDLSGERYEYETNMLLEAKRRGVPIVEVPIRTVYLEQNASSHFHPLRDSAAIYKQIFRFMSSGITSMLIDLGLFTLLNWLLSGLPASTRLLAATLGARAVSSLFNFSANRTLVFGGGSALGRSAVRYYILCALQAGASYGGVYLLSGVAGFPALPAKMIVDTLLFFLSFQIQREWVFSKEGNGVTDHGDRK